MFRIFDKLGGEEKCLAIIAKAEGKQLSPFTRAAWRQYRRIPAIRAVHLLDECARRGIKASYAKDCTAPLEAAE